MAPSASTPTPGTLATAALTPVGGVLAQTTTRADAAGYQRLLGFARGQVPGRRGWAVEGAGSYGAGLAAFLQQRGERVVEVGRPKRPARRTGAKSDALDAVRPRPRGTWPGARRRGQREALRALLATRRCATRARVAAIGGAQSADRARRAARGQHRHPDPALRQPPSPTGPLAPSTR